MLFLGGTLNFLLVDLCNQGTKMNQMGEKGCGKLCSRARWSETLLDLEETCPLPPAYVISESCTMDF